MASGPWAPMDVERRANAFAAMLLMPPQLVSRAIATIADPLESAAGVKQVARRLETSYSATLNHLSNLGYLDSTARAMLAEGGDTVLDSQQAP